MPLWTYLLLDLGACFNAIRLLADANFFAVDPDGLRLLMYWRVWTIYSSSAMISADVCSHFMKLVR